MILHIHQGQSGRPPVGCMLGLFGSEIDCQQGSNHNHKPQDGTKIHSFHLYLRECICRAGEPPVGEFRINIITNIWFVDTVNLKMSQKRIMQPLLGVVVPNVWTIHIKYRLNLILNLGMMYRD